VMRNRTTVPVSRDGTLDVQRDYICMGQAGPQGEIPELGPSTCPQCGASLYVITYSPVPAEVGGSTMVSTRAQRLAMTTTGRWEWRCPECGGLVALTAMARERGSDD
jgi:predicted RNA-binding Zn-ribbon protein involved in translation (DUF1610 family)